jgi:outer membrane lipoprotein SlyB
MKHLVHLPVIATLLFASACARDISSATYTSDSTLNLTLEGQVISVRAVTVKNSDKLSDNSTGMLAGGAAGAVTGGNLGKGGGQAVGAIGGAIAGAVVGSVIEGQLGKTEGIEYIVKVDISKLKSPYYEGSGAMRNAISSATTSGLVTIVQGTEAPVAAGSKVYVIFSDKRTRIIPAS